MRPGGGLAEDYLAALEAATSGAPEATMIVIIALFAVAHSGLAALRPKGG